MGKDGNGGLLFESRVEVSEVLGALSEWRGMSDKNRGNVVVKETVDMLEEFYLSW